MWIDVLGLVAGAVINIGFIPQVWRLFKLKSAREISFPFTILLAVGVICWLVYGIVLRLSPVILWNSITLVLASAMLFAKIRYGRS